MKIEYVEADYDFYLDFKAETIKDAAFLTRMGINYTVKRKFYLSIDAFKDGNFFARLQIPKRKNFTCTVPKKR